MIYPFSQEDGDRFQIWEMLVQRDITAFIKQDWTMVEDDFAREEFFGIDAGLSFLPDRWEARFGTLQLYRDEWLKQAIEYGRKNSVEEGTEKLIKATVLEDIKIKDDVAVVYKKFIWDFLRKEKDAPLDWQTIYYCRKKNGKWKIIGFTGYLPFNATYSRSPQAINRPSEAKQHKTAGPYSPVLVVQASQFIVISGQAAINDEGAIVGNTIEDQARYTLENCRRQLESAGTNMHNVFKVNVYLKELADWPRFNTVYANYFSDPLPVRTAVQTGLLSSLLVEVELWAIK